MKPGGSKFSIMLGESLLYDREEVNRRKEGVYQEDTGDKGIPFEMGCSLIPVSVLQLYIVSISVDCAQYAQNQGY